MVKPISEFATEYWVDEIPGHWIREPYGSVGPVVIQWDGTYERRRWIIGVSNYRLSTSGQLVDHNKTVDWEKDDVYPEFIHEGTPQQVYDFYQMWKAKSLLQE